MVYLFNDLIMLIFSDRFYETVASIGFVKHLLVTFILYKRQYLLLMREQQQLIMSQVGTIQELPKLHKVFG